MKCEWCERYKVTGPWGTGSGCITLQHDAISTHAKSSGHKMAMAQWTCDVEKKAKSIPTHVTTMEDVNKERVITTMKLMYFVAKNDFSISSFEALCGLAIDLQVPNMPKNNDYATYTNRMAGNQFLQAMSEHILELQIVKMMESPFFALMLDESTDHSLELHLILYTTYLDAKNTGKVVSEYMSIDVIPDGRGRTILNTVQKLIEKRCLKINKLIGIASDGASAMVGSELGVVSLLKNEVPSLVAVHCVAHRQALAASDASKFFPKLAFIEKFANKVYSWVSNSAKRNNELMSLIDEMDLGQPRHVLHVHGIRWLSRGEVMERLVNQMPAILTMWKNVKQSNWYEKARIFSVQFMLHMLADVLKELNKLNKNFQEEHVDLTILGSSIDVTINHLQRTYLREGQFAHGTFYLSKFLESSKGGYLQIQDKEGVPHHHELLFCEVPEDRDHAAREGGKKSRARIDGSLESCVTLAKDYIQLLIDGLNARFPDLPLFNAAKLFSPCHYAHDAILRETNAKRWLEKLLQHLQPEDDFNLNHDVIFDVEGCKRELYGFVDILFLNCEGFSMKEAWRIFSMTKDWQDSFPNIMKVWQALLVIPASTVQCERGFSKQNAIKDLGRTRLSIETLDSLLRISINGPPLNEVEWNRVFEIWREKKDRRMSCGTAL